MMKPRRPRVPDDPRELTIDLLPEGEVDDEQVETTLERGLGFNLPGYLPPDDDEVAGSGADGIDDEDDEDER